MDGPEDEYESGSGSYEEESTEEEEEPQLKYQRLGASVTEILKRDSACCLTVNDKFLAMGTEMGTVFIFDFNGNEIRKFNAHPNFPIRDLSIDQAGEYVGSCADDGRVIINGLYNKDFVEHKFPKPVSCISLDPHYSKSRDERFVCGTGGKLIHSEKGWWVSQNVLHEGEGPIYAISWQGDLIAWANDVGVKIHDTSTRERITYIDRPRGSPRPDLYRCCLSWENATTIIIGWGDYVKIGVVKIRKNGAEGLPSRCVEIVAMFKIENCFVSGIAPFKEDLIIFAYPEGAKTKPGEAPARPLPEVRIMTRNGDEVCSEALSISGYERYGPLHYRLDHLTLDSHFYLVSPKEIVVAKPRDLDDNIAWYLEKGQYEKCLRAMEGRERELQRHDFVKVGEKYIDFLLANGDNEKAAEICPKILKKDAELWEKWIYNFAKQNQLKAIGPYIPVGNPTLSDVLYEMVLSYFLSNDPVAFEKMITDWSPTVYSLPNLINAVEWKVKTNPDKHLMIALGKLYTYDKQFDKTLAIYLHLDSGNVFDLIKEHNLFDKIGDKVYELMKFDEPAAIQLLVNNIKRVPVANVMKQLEKHQKMQLAYLDYLFFQTKKDNHQVNQEGREFHNLQVRLYAEFNTTPLLEFLEKSGYCDIDQALLECTKRELWREVVYILGRLGSHEKALHLLIEKVGDVRQAIDLVQKQNDPHLWDELIDQSIRNPEFVSGLLDNLGTHINPLKLIQKIPNGMQITGLRDRLVKIINDYSLQTSLSQGCVEVLKADVIALNKRLYVDQRAAIRIDQNTVDHTTQSTVLGCQKKKNFVVFVCRHTYYEQDLIKLMGQQSMQRATAPGQMNAQQLEQLQAKFRTQGYFCPACRQNAENISTKLERRRTRK